MKRLLYGVLLFVPYALVGPAIVNADLLFLLHVSRVAYEFVAWFWPFWWILGWGPDMGTLQALGLAVLLNVCSFAALGLLAGVASRSTVALFALFICASAALTFPYFMGAMVRCTAMRQCTLYGGSLVEIPYFSLGAAWLLFSVPFVILARVRNNR